MSKLLKLKKQMPVNDAAKYLSKSLNEEVTEADVLYLGLSGKLRLSVYFVNETTAHFCEIFLDKEAPLVYENSSGAIRRVTDKVAVDIFHTDISWISGVYDLPMFGSEYDFVRNEYQRLANGPSVNLKKHQFAIVGSKFYYYALCKRLEDAPITEEEDKREEYNQKYYELGHLPNDCQIVIRTSALEEFVLSLSESTTKVPMAEQSDDKKSRKDALRVEIEEIISSGTPEKLEAVWKALVKRCGKKGSCCISVEESDKGPVIAFRGKENRLKRLNKKALSERLRNINTE
jgi:hypothetical protein